MTRSGPSLWPTRRHFTCSLGGLAALLSVFRGGAGSAQAADDEWHVIRGEIAPARAAPAFEGATVNVYLENVTDLDARARVVAHLILKNVSGGGAKSPPIRFAFGEFKPEPDANYSIRAHIDLTGDGRISRGDLVSSENYSVLTKQAAERLTVRVEIAR